MTYQAPRAERDRARLRSPKMLDRAMLRQDVSGAELARFAGTTRQEISLLRTGKRATCRVVVADRIEARLAADPGGLFVRIDDGQQQADQGDAAAMA